MVNVILRSKV